MTLLQKILFTAVFTVYWFIFYGGVYHALACWNPALVEIPESPGQAHVLGAMGIFTLLVFLAYAGAGYVVLGRLPGADRDSDFDFESGRRSSRGRRRGEPAPGDRLRKSRRLFGGGRDAADDAPRSTPARPAQPARRDGRGQAVGQRRPRNASGGGQNQKARRPNQRPGSNQNRDSGAPS